MAEAGAVNFQCNHREKLQKALDTQSTGFGKQRTQCTVGDACDASTRLGQNGACAQDGNCFPLGNS
jgi:hypothetical protein